MIVPRPRPAVLAAQPYVEGEGAAAGVNRVVKLSANEGALGPPPAAMAAYARAASELHRYPDGSCAALRRAIGARFGLDPARIVCGAGSDELISLLCQIYAGPDTEIVMSRHGFSMYEIAGKLAGAAVVKAPERRLTADVDALLACVSPATRLVFLANPGNPTGSIVPSGEVERLRAGLPPEVLLVLDAAYAEYVERPDYHAGAALVDAGENTVMTRTFSKAFGMGGVRLGWAYAPAAVADALNRARGPFNVGRPAQEAGVAALAEPGWVERSRAHNARARAWLAAELERAGLRVWPSEANFLLVDFGDPARADAADRFLRARGVVVRSTRSYGLPECLRVTVGTDEECALVAEGLAAFVADQAAHA